MVRIQLCKFARHALEPEKREEIRVIDSDERDIAKVFRRIMQHIVIVSVQVVERAYRLHLLLTAEECGKITLGDVIGESLSDIVLLHAIHPFGIREAPVVAPVVADLRLEDHEDGQGGGEAEEV